jgi:chromosome segregation ATPase
MACIRLVLAALVLASCAEAASVSPVQKVLQMMSEMKAKGEKGMEEETKIFGTYSEWVDDESTKLGFSITTAKKDIDEFLAFIAKADSDVDTLSAGVSELDGEIKNLQGEKSEATALRAQQHEEYVKVSTDYSESVDALRKAIQTLGSKNYDVAQAESMLQRMAASTPGMRRVLAEFLQTGGKQEQQRGGPAVAAYEFQSNSIVQLLEKFLDKFKGELADVEEAESNQAHNYEQEVLHLSDTIAYSQKEHEEKSTLKAKRAAESAQAKGDLNDTRNDLAADEKTLSDMKATFAAKTDQYKQNQSVRKDELEAIGKAIEIISDQSVAGSASKHNLGLVQKTTFLQLRSASSRVAARDRAAAFLQKRAAALSSQALQSLAAQLNASPFDKVIQMIKDLVAKLKEEAAAEAEHKQWCDEQLKSNKIKREKKTAKVNKLTAGVDGLTEDIASMAKKIATLQKEQSDLAKAMSEATSQRNAEKTKNTQTMEDAAAGEAAVKQALVVLREFYSSQSFVQQVPEMAAYKGMQSAKGGVVGMLEVIASDFARLNADTKAAEYAAATEYATFTADSKALNKEKHDLEFKTSMAKDQAEFEKGNTEKDLKSTQKELDSALEYQAQLKPVCLEVHVSYEERVAARKAEIEALKEAYSILDQK